MDEITRRRLIRHLDNTVGLVEELGLPGLTPLLGGCIDVAVAEDEHCLNKALEGIGSELVALLVGERPLRRQRDAHSTEHYRTGDFYPGATNTEGESEHASSSGPPLPSALPERIVDKRRLLTAVSSVPLGEKEDGCR